MKKSKNGYFHPENVYRNLKFIFVPKLKSEAPKKLLWQAFSLVFSFISEQTKWDVQSLDDGTFKPIDSLSNFGNDLVRRQLFIQLVYFGFMHS